METKMKKKKNKKKKKKQAKGPPEPCRALRGDPSRAACAISYRTSQGFGVARYATSVPGISHSA
eukprot:3089185-Rhodomonas_salina.1